MYTIWIQMLHHYSCARQWSINTDHKQLVAIFKKDVATLSKKPQQILFRMYQYRVRILSKPGTDLFMADWLSRQNCKENKDEEIPGMQLNIDAIQTATNIPDCMTIQELQQATSQNGHLQELKEHHHRLPKEQRSNTTRLEKILGILRSHGSD